MPIVSNNSVDSITEYVTDHNSGVLMSSIEDIDLNTLNELKQKDRKAISEAGILKFGIDTIVNKYLQTYTTLDSL